MDCRYFRTELTNGMLMERFPDGELRFSDTKGVRYPCSPMKHMPAYVMSSGTIVYTDEEGRRHSHGDTPAFIQEHYKEWMFHGDTHRDPKLGPAVIEGSYYVDGKVAKPPPRSSECVEVKIPIYFTPLLLVRKEDGTVSFIHRGGNTPQTPGLGIPAIVYPDGTIFEGRESKWQEKFAYQQYLPE
ncbi:hypothetical protein UFOVP75_48 [uncultured Caudovirales phage]|uniref:Uncharacterized protein n=1 Tax=uncultured Caudovirales phage TaxID=2100421 RepID=A0A6J5L4V9_9CAUD|nr:hypothetical protein UFOVP75_48 [uncultured Caudovirales phage]